MTDYACPPTLRQCGMDSDVTHLNRMEVTPYLEISVMLTVRETAAKLHVSMSTTYGMIPGGNSRVIEWELDVE